MGKPNGAALALLKLIKLFIESTAVEMTLLEWADGLGSK